MMKVRPTLLVLWHVLLPFIVVATFMFAGAAEVTSRFGETIGGWTWVGVLIAVCVILQLLAYRLNRIDPPSRYVR